MQALILLSSRWRLARMAVFAAGFVWLFLSYEEVMRNHAVDRTVNDDNRENSNLTEIQPFTQGGQSNCCHPVSGRAAVSTCRRKD